MEPQFVPCELKTNSLYTRQIHFSCQRVNDEYWDACSFLSLYLTEQVCDHAVGREDAEVHFVPVEAVACK